MISFVKYKPQRQHQWDDFVSRSKNGTFLFYREYMDYHADRFPDSSLMIIDEQENLLALLPATAQADTLSSHAGLTFGGLVTDSRMKAALMLEVFDALKSHLRTAGFKRLLYKVIPHIYHVIPAEEDLYALFRHDARLVRRDISSTIYLSEKLPLSKGRKYEIKQAGKHGLEVKPTDDFESFMAIEEKVLGEKYDSRPVHSAAELKLLATRFPEHIKLFAAYRAEQMLAGVVVYETSAVAHAQYIAASDEGKSTGALDLILAYLINDFYSCKKYFDFGISTEKQGRELNVGLIDNKQSFGGRAIVHDFYELEITND
jgi:Acetyltransferase (GNAT) domain